MRTARVVVVHPGDIVLLGGLVEDESRDAVTQVREGLEALGITAVGFCANLTVECIEQASHA